MLREDVIEHAVSDLASLVVFSLKKVGKLRLCVDYSKLMAMTVRDTQH